MNISSNDYLLRACSEIACIERRLKNIVLFLNKYKNKFKQILQLYHKQIN